MGKSTLLRLLTSGTVGEGGVGVSELAGDGTVVRIYVGELQIGEHHVVVEFIEPADDDFSVASGLYSQADGVLLVYDATRVSTLRSLWNYWISGVGHVFLEAEAGGEGGDAAGDVAIAADLRAVGQREASAMLDCPVLYVRCKVDQLESVPKSPTGDGADGCSHALSEEERVIESHLMNAAAAMGMADVIRFGEFVLQVLGGRAAAASEPAAAAHPGLRSLAGTPVSHLRRRAATAGSE